MEMLHGILYFVFLLKVTQWIYHHQLQFLPHQTDPNMSMAIWKNRMKYHGQLCGMDNIWILANLKATKFLIKRSMQLIDWH